MTKAEALIILNTALQVSETAFSKLGLASKRFYKTFASDYSDLADEEYFVKKDFAKLEGGQAVKDQQGNLVMDTAKEKELFAAVKAWKKEECDIDWSKFTPIKLEGKLLFMSAPIYDTLNGYVFDVSEEDYLAAIEAEIIRQNETK